MNFFNKSIILKKNTILFLSIFIAVFFTTCKKLEFERVMDVRTDEIKISGTSVLVYGTVLDVGASNIISHGHCWSRNPEPSINDFNTNLGSVIMTRDFFSKLNNLTPGITYYVRSYLYDGNEYTYGDVVSFEITADDIQFVTSNIKKLDATSIKLSSSTKGIGSVNFSNHGHCWSQIDPPTINDDKTAFGPFDSDTTFDSKINNLTLGRYYIRGYLEAEGVIIYSNTLTYESLITINTDQITPNLDNTAIAFGTIKSLGVNQIINYGHCYSTVTSSPDLNSTSEHNSLGPSNQLGSFSSELTGLVSGRVYYVRAYATDGINVYYGEIKNFIAN